MILIKLCIFFCGEHLHKLTMCSEGEQGLNTFVCWIICKIFLCFIQKYKFIKKIEKEEYF